MKKTETNQGFLILSIQLLSILLEIESFSPKNIYPRPKHLLLSPEQSSNVGEPLFITPYLENGKIDEARHLSRVRNLTDVVSYSGYITVNPEYNSNMYFWYFPAAFNPETAPLLLWLQGGPGGSSLFGLFVENGPFKVNSDYTVDIRNTAWTLTHNVIYLDNPVGTGFSFTDNDAGYARNEEDVGKYMYNFLTQFLTLFPELASRDFYVTGESYAGKYIPAICYKIHVENQQTPEVKINLKGMAIGDGFSDPINMLNYGKYLYGVGLLDQNERDFFLQEEERARDQIRQEKWDDAFRTIDSLMDADLTGVPSSFMNATGFTFYFNFLMSSSPPEHNYYSTFVQLDYIRRSLHVGNKSYAEGGKVEDYLRGDMYKSVAPWIQELLDAPEKYNILFYSGQLDIIVANINTDNMLNNLKWKGSQKYLQSQRKIWMVGKDVAGYVKKSKNLTYLFFRNAGHMVPYDQPKWSFDMINRFTSGKPFA